jgi:hypothetical protein
MCCFPSVPSTAVGVVIVDAARGVKDVPGSIPVPGPKPVSAVADPAPRAATAHREMIR